jgi:hypothetical protein
VLDPEDQYLRKQVISLKLARRLCELGLPQRSVFIWETANSNWQPRCQYLEPQRSEYLHRYSAYMASEIGALLPSTVTIYKRSIGGHWECSLNASDGNQKPCVRIRAHTMVDAMAKMLIYLVDQRIIKLHGQQSDDNSLGTHTFADHLLTP